jgi:hypothetical protein
VGARDQPEFEAGDETVIWRYVPLHRFHDLLSGYLYFAAAHQFDDPFEGAITDAESAWREQEARRHFDDEDAQSWLAEMSSAFAELRRLTKVNCWHAATSENVAMWERYMREKKAGVAVRSTVGALKRSLREFRLQPTYGEETIVVGRVRYIDFGAQQLIHRSMLETFFYKRIEYRDEQEIRAILSLRMAEEFGVPVPPNGVNVGVALDELLDEVRVSADAGEDVLEEVGTALRDLGLTCMVTRSTLARTPTY